MWASPSINGFLMFPLHADWEAASLLPWLCGAETQPPGAPVPHTGENGALGRMDRGERGTGWGNYDSVINSDVIRVPRACGNPLGVWKSSTFHTGLQGRGWLEQQSLLRAWLPWPCVGKACPALGLQRGPGWLRVGGWKSPTQHWHGKSRAGKCRC